MNKRLPLLFSLLLCLSSCAPGASSSSGGSVLSNPGFELGSYEGWLAEGAAFSFSTLSVAGSDALRLRVEGTFYYDGELGGEGATGTLTSEPFVLRGNGRVSYLLGGGKDENLCRVELIDEEGEVLLSQGNILFDEDFPSKKMYRQHLEAKQYVGETLRLRLVDQDYGNDGYNYLLFDGLELDSTLEDDLGTLLDDAQDYVEKAAPLISDTYRHAYHLMPPTGWMNDPNGFTYYDGYYHLFYQHNPYSPNWDTMHWGHARSKDLVKWEHLPVALAPDEAYDRGGCFSGGAVVKNGSLELLYTSVSPSGAQTQSLATSYDGVNFSKRSLNPVIPSSLNLGSGINDFRDPFVYEHEGRYYAVIGSKSPRGGGLLGLYSSSDLLSWRSVGPIYEGTETGGGIFECPGLALMGEKAVVFSSPQNVRDADKASYQNTHSVTYMVGDLDHATGNFVNDGGPGYMQELDKGFDFYATQVYQEEERTLLLGWMNMWDRSNASSAYGWTGEVTLPREITLRDGHVYQEPIRELRDYYRNETEISVPSGTSTTQLPISGNTKHIYAEIDVSTLGYGKAGFELFASQEHALRLYYDGAEGLLVLDREDSPFPIVANTGDGEKHRRYARVEPVDGKITLEIFLDVSCCEVFVNGGYYTMSGLYYPDEEGSGISFYREGGSSSLSGVAHDIEVGHEL